MAMGMNPTQVGECSLWEFHAAAEGFRRAHMTPEEQAHELSKDDVESLSSLIGL